MKKTYPALVAILLTGNQVMAQVQEPYRPTYHYSAAKNWINDPNGLIYYAGEYHLFTQHNPFGNVWGHMSWGHAVSNDLLHWKQLPLAIPEIKHPDGKTETAIFSGSTIVDRGNKSGLCPAGTKDCMVAFYTGNVSAGDKHLAQYQNMAFSADKGRTWTQYAQNPVIDIGSKEFRDPNVFWYAPQKKWVMATVKATEHRVAFYESSDLKKWTFMSHFGGVGDVSKVWECPTLVQVPVAGEQGKSAWVLFISAGHLRKEYVGMQYFVGNFDGTTFTLSPENPKAIAPATGNIVDYGRDYYAAIPFNDLPDGAQGPLMMGWMNNWAYANDLPTTPFKGVYSLPRRISLKRTPAGLQLVQVPYAGVAGLRGKAQIFPMKTLSDGQHVLVPETDNTYELQLEILPGKAQAAGIKIAVGENEETVVRYSDGMLQFDRRKSGNTTFNTHFSGVDTAPVNLSSGVLRLHIFVDKSVVELFVNDGERVISEQIFPAGTQGGISLFAEGGEAQFRTIRYRELKKSM